MSNWETQHIDIGTIKSNKRQTIKFYAVKKLPKIKEIHTGCSCSTGKFDEKNNVLSVQYYPFSVPIHLKSKGFYTISKRVYVIYENGDKDVLSFGCKVF